MFCTSYGCSIFFSIQCVNLERISEYFICTYASKNTLKRWKNLQIFVMVRWNENQIFFLHTLNNGNFYNHNLKMDLLWSRLLLPCMDVEQKNWGFLLQLSFKLTGFFSTFSCKTSDRKRAGGSEPTQPPLRAGHSEKLLRFTIFSVEISEVMKRNEGCLVFPDSSSFLWCLFLKDRKTLGSLVSPSIFLS